MTQYFIIGKRYASRFDIASDMKVAITALWVIALATGITCYIEDDIKDLQKSVKILLREMLNMGQSIVEVTQTMHQSGIVNLRQESGGPKPYDNTARARQGIHDHCDFKYVLGTSELEAVINGITVKTRHNDMPAYMPHPTSSEYHATIPIEPNAVPKDVLRETTVEGQAAVMRKYLKAFKEEDDSIADYRPYFTPVLCYLEGAWTDASDDDIDEPFYSARHKLQANFWSELSEKIIFSTDTGSKNDRENWMYSPTAIKGIINDTIPIIGQFNYRIMCHPLNGYLEKTELCAVDDISTRLKFNLTMEKYTQLRTARFQLCEDSHPDGKYQKIDALMSQVPGMDNYKANLQDDKFGLVAMDYNDITKILNAGFYHRYYNIIDGGSTAAYVRKRAFNDGYIFMAMNTQRKIIPAKVKDRCRRNLMGEKYCKDEYEQRWSYAIPLEIFYNTPFGNWNPYNLLYNATGEHCKSCRGSCSDRKNAYRMITDSNFFTIPEEFYQNMNMGGKVQSADTKRSACVIDQDGVWRKVFASGHSVQSCFPGDEGIECVRMRYPIGPVSQEGSLTHKDLMALKDLLLNPNMNSKLKEEYIEKNSWPSNN